MSEWDADLVVLVPDRDMEASVEGLLSRPADLGIRPLKYVVYRHIGRDPGCFQEGSDFLRPMAKQYAHALLMFDRAGSGQERHAREEIERIMTQGLSRSGWGDRADTVVLDPELEVWVWSEDPRVASCLGWSQKATELLPWLRERGVWTEGDKKPRDPKRAVQRAIRQVGKPRSSSLYGQLARSVSFEQCTDSAFAKFLHTLRNWFGEEQR